MIFLCFQVRQYGEYDMKQIKTILAFPLADNTSVDLLAVYITIPIVLAMTLLVFGTVVAYRRRHQHQDAEKIVQDSSGSNSNASDSSIIRKQLVE